MLMINGHLSLVHFAGEWVEDRQLGSVIQAHLQPLALGSTVLEPKLDVLALQTGKLLPAQNETIPLT